VKSQTTDTKRVYRITIAYDGTGFLGWQRQGEHPTVQLAIEKALAKCWGEPITLHGAGRTDTGVHALAQEAHFEATPKFDRPTLVRALNNNLPESVRITRTRFGPTGFHSRFWAIGKEYVYRVWNDPVMSPFEVNRAMHVPRPLDLAEMRRVAKVLTGKHDFASFTSNPGYVRKGTIRTIYRIRIQRGKELLTFRFHGSGFLYRMVRNLMGAILRVGLRRMTVEEVEAVLRAKKRMTAPNTSPACGLYLARVIHGRGPVPKPFDTEEEE